MKNSICRTLMRFHGPNLVLGGQSHARTNVVTLLIARYKAEMAMLNTDKLSETEAYTDINGLSWLHKAAPGFFIHGSQITIIHEPSDFYQLLLRKCQTAQKRITIASLYLGTGKQEADLVVAIKDRLQQSNGNLKVEILLDHMRGSRGKYNSRTMLQPLLDSRWEQNCQVSLYHTPKLRGILRALVPNRFNELIGLQHMKVYLFDDTLIISGANLSSDYFTNRQDRYIVIEDCKELCDFYASLISRVCEYSFRLLADGNTTFDRDSSTHPYRGKRKDFTNAMAKSIKSLFQEEMRRRSEMTKQESVSDADTWIFPLVEMGQLNIRHDSEVTLRLLQTAPAGATLKLATGYFNLIPAYRKALLNDCHAVCHLLTSHPTANGFYGAKGVAGSIPAAYTKIEQSFCKMCEKKRQDYRITLWEFARQGWTYHAKGLWYSLPGQQKPCLTLIGSPNFGYRSVRKDLETQIAVVTKNTKLQDALHLEQERLFTQAKPVNNTVLTQRDRIPPAWVCVAVFFFRYFF